MTEDNNTRRRFLALSGSATLVGLAGCTDRFSSETSEENGSGSSNESTSDTTGQGETNSYEPPALTVETEYNSREEFGQPGEAFDDFEELDV